MRKEKMMYTWFGIILIVILLAGQGDIRERGVDDGGGMLPSPTEEEMTEHQKREKWLEDMHQAGPGVNWRMMNLQWRLGRMESYLKAGRAKSRSGITIGGVLEGVWQERGSRNLSGRIHVAEIDSLDQMLYCASSGGQIWRTPLNGSTQWEVLTDHFQVKGIHLLRILPHGNGKRVLIASDAGSTPGVYYSDDTCATWQAASGTMTSSWGYVRRAVIANNTQKTIYLLAQGWDSVAVVRILKSTDLGTTFQEVLSFPENQVGSIRRCDIWADRYGTGRVFYARGPQVYELVQNQPVLQGTFTSSYQNQVRLSGYERGAYSWLYALMAESANVSVYQSQNAGVNWTYKGGVQETPFMINSFTCSADNPSMLYFGGVEAYRSPTGGVNWYKKNAWQDYYSNMNYTLHADIPGLYSFRTAQGEVLFICTDGGIYRSDNAMQTVTNLSLQDLNVSQYYSVYTSRVNTNFIHAGSQDQGYQRSTSLPGQVKTFDQVWSGDYGHIVSGDSGLSIWMNYPGLTVHYNDILYSTSRTWWEFEFENALWIPPMMVDPYDKNNVIIAGGNFGGGGAYLIMLTYTGVGAQMVWYVYPCDFGNGSGSVKISAVAASPLDKDCWYVLTNDGKFFHSADAGYTWTLEQDFNFSFGHYFYGADILPSPNEEGKVYVCGSGYSNPPVFELTDYGSTVKPINNGIPNTLVYALECTPEEGLLFAATELGPYVYISSMEQWFDLSEGWAPDQTYWSVDYIESLKTVRFGTYGRGIWDFSMCGSSTTQPVAAFSSTPGTTYLEVHFQDLSTGDPFTWLWDFGDGTTSVSQSPTHIYKTPGTYTVRLVTGNVCHRDTIVKTIQVTQIGLEEKIPQPSVTLYPNPASEVLFIHADGTTEEDITMVDIRGRRVSPGYSGQGPGIHRLDVSALSPGTYFVSLLVNGSQMTRKVLISK